MIPSPPTKARRAATNGSPVRKGREKSPKKNRASPEGATQSRAKKETPSTTARLYPLPLITHPHSPPDQRSPPHRPPKFTPGPRTGFPRIYRLPTPTQSPPFSTAGPNPPPSATKNLTKRQARRLRRRGNNRPLRQPPHPAPRLLAPSQRNPPTNPTKKFSRRSATGDPRQNEVPQSQPPPAA